MESFITVLKNPSILPLYARWHISQTRRVHGHGVSHFATFGDYFHIHDISPTKAEMDFLRSIPRGIAIDVGANIGAWALCLDGLGFAVHCFEPAPDTFARLSKNCPNLSRHQIAMSDHCGTATMTNNIRANALNHLSADGSCRINTTTLDAYCANLGTIAFVKIDVEGAEPLVLRGATELLKTRPPLIIECDAQNLSQIGFDECDILDPLERAGYTIKQREGRNLIAS